MSFSPHFLQLLQKAIQRREGLRGITNAVRLINGEAGLEGLFLDQYDRHFVLQVFDREWLTRKDGFIKFVKDLGGQYLIVKDRSQSSAPDPDSVQMSVWIEESPAETVVQEYDLKFEVTLRDTLNSGLFLDMRQNRRIVGNHSRVRKVLNCFAYTCSFGVHARAGGAVSVVNVDVSAKSLNRGRANYELNGFTQQRNEFIRADAGSDLKRAVEKDNRFDLIILDPPSFARFEGKTFSVKKDLPAMLALAMKVLNPGGIIFLSTNLSSLSHGNLETMLTTAYGRGPKKFRRLGADVDFVGTNQSAESYLAAVLMEV